jgi:hypothetical protein
MLGVNAEIVYVPMLIMLGLNPPPAAMALIVVVDATGIGPVYWVDEVVGVVPFVV